MWERHFTELGVCRAAELQKPHCMQEKNQDGTYGSIYGAGLLQSSACLTGRVVRDSGCHRVPLSIESSFPGKAWECPVNTVGSLFSEGYEGIIQIIRSCWGTTQSLPQQVYLTFNLWPLLYLEHLNSVQAMASLPPTSLQWCWEVIRLWGWGPHEWN